jgi:hypothetical protein
LFLNGIIPDSGSLAIPVIDEFYQDWYSMFSPSQFRFDYEAQTIRIPVWAGKINFNFGSETVFYDFPDNGTYEVQFSADWNNVTGATKICPLIENFSYLPPVETEHLPPEPTPTPSPQPTPTPSPQPTPTPSPLLDTEAPTLKVVSPKNETYIIADIPLLFTLSESTSKINYSLDGCIDCLMARIA